MLCFATADSPPFNPSVVDSNSTVWPDIANFSLGVVGQQEAFALQNSPAISSLTVSFPGFYSSTNLTGVVVEYSGLSAGVGNTASSNGLATIPPSVTLNTLAGNSAVVANLFCGGASSFLQGANGILRYQATNNDAVAMFDNSAALPGALQINATFHVNTGHGWQFAAVELLPQGAGAIPTSGLEANSKVPYPGVFDTSVQNSTTLSALTCWFPESVFTIVGRHPVATRADGALWDTVNRVFVTIDQTTLGTVQAPKNGQ